MVNISVPDLNKEFEVPPYSQSVELGSQVEMRCHPPSGQPKPRVSHCEATVRPRTDCQSFPSDFLAKEQGGDDCWAREQLPAGC